MKTAATRFFASAPQQEKKPKVSIRPTHYGLGLLFLLVWVPFTALATANNFLLIVFMMLVGIVVVSHNFAKKNIRLTTVYRRFPDEIFAETPFGLKYFVKSTRPVWGSLTLRLTEAEPLELEKEKAFLPAAPPEKTTKALTMATFTTRGLKEVTPATLESEFPFGLATYRRSCAESAQIVVFPKIENVSSHVPPWAGGLGTGRDKPTTHGMVPFHFRQYVSGDAYKRIDWKKTAQTGEIIVKTMADEEARHMTIQVPGAASEKALSRAASLVVYFSKARIPLHLVGPGIELGPDLGAQFTRKILTTLALWDNPQGRMARRAGFGPTVDVSETGDLLWRSPR